MELIGYNRENLLQLIDSPDFDRVPNIPISRIRAISQCNNPRALDSDILLMCIWENQSLLAYLGMLPDDLQDGPESVHFAWLSCLWVNPDHRGRQLSKKLLHAAADAWRGNLMGTEFVPSLGAMYQRSGLFAPFKWYQGKRIYLRFYLEAWLPPKNRFWQFIKPLLRRADQALNYFIKSKKRTLPLSYQDFRVHEIPQDVAQWFKRFHGDNAFGRSAPDLNWILQFPWIHTEPDGDEKRYHFSVYDPSFRQVALVISSNTGEVEGFTILIHRNKTIKTTYLYCLPEQAGTMASIIEDYAWQHQAAVILTWQKPLIEHFQKSGYPGWLTRDAVRIYMAAPTLSPLLKKSIQDGDGDCAFT
jgi:GNAT superfamily N-acetyltransferase